MGRWHTIIYYNILENRISQCASVFVCVCLYAGVIGCKQQDVQYKLQGSGLESSLKEDIGSLRWYAIWT